LSIQAERKPTKKRKKVFGPISIPILVNDSKVAEFNLLLYKIGSENYHVLENLNNTFDEIPYLRIESACTFAHIYGSKLCDCEQQLRSALNIISEHSGILIYALDQHGRGIGLYNHVRVYQKEQEGFDTVQAHKALGLDVDARKYSNLLLILRDFNIKKVKLLTNNPDRIKFCEANLEYCKRVALNKNLDRFNVRELMIKKEKMGHLFSFKSDTEWIANLKKRRLGPYVIVKNANKNKFSGNQKNLIEKVNKLKGGLDDFFTIYILLNKMSFLGFKKLILKLIKGNSSDIHLRLIFTAKFNKKEIKELRNITDKTVIKEIKCIYKY